MNAGELILRFFLGGIFVSLFSAIGQAFKPKTFSGLFGAAPPVAIASIVIEQINHGARHTEVEARSMIIGALAFVAYGLTCIVLTKREHLQVLVSAVASWIAWLAVAGIGLLLLRAVLA